MSKKPLDDLRALLRMLPDDIGTPECVLESDGQIGFDWDITSNCVLSMNINDDGRVGFSFLNGELSGFGHFYPSREDMPYALEPVLKSIAELLR